MPTRLPTLDTLRSLYARGGYAFFDQGDLNLNVFMIRCLPGVPDRFDDLLGCAWREDGAWRVEGWAATTDPGLAYLGQQKGNPEGTFVRCPGQVRGSHEVGLHRGQYPALVQRRPLRGWRDRDQDGLVDRSGPVVEGVFGVNVHHAGVDSPRVANWSAGCTVVQRMTDWKRFWGLVTRAAAAWGPVFTTTLFEVQ